MPDLSALPMRERSIKGKVPFKVIVAKYAGRPQDAADLRDKLRVLAASDSPGGRALCLMGAALYSTVYDHIVTPLAR